MTEKPVPPVTADELRRAFLVFMETVDPPDVKNGEPIDAGYILSQMRDELQTDDPEKVIAVFQRCCALQNAMESSLFGPDGDDAIPLFIVDIAATCTVVDGASDGQNFTPEFDRDEFVAAANRRLGN
jgi:hypothetical protein